MKQNLLITVYSNAGARDKKAPVFERSLWLDPNVIFSYSSVVETLRFLFGCNCIISFESQNVG